MRRPLVALWLTNNAVAVGITAIFLAGGLFFALVGQGGLASIEPRTEAGFAVGTSLGGSGVRRERAPGLSHTARLRLPDGGVLTVNLSSEAELRQGERVCLALFRGRWTGRRIGEAVNRSRCEGHKPAG